MAFVYWIHLPEHTDMFSEGYVGFTNGTVEKRWKQHISDSKRSPHVMFYKALKKYQDKLIIDTLVEGAAEYCLDLEYKLRPSEKIGWNTFTGGSKGSLGVKRSKESCEKHSMAISGENHHNWGKKIPKSQIEKGLKTRKGNFSGVSESTREKLSKANKGKIRSTEARENISKGLKGVKKSEDHKQLISKSLKDKNLKPWENYNADKLIWTKSICIFLMMNKGVSVSQIERDLNLGFRSLATISKKIKLGWVPSEDQEYLAWLKQYEEAKYAKT